MDGADVTPSRFFALFSGFRPFFRIFFRKSRFFLKKRHVFFRFGFEIPANRM